MCDITTVNITNQDIEALSRLVQAEADSIVAKGYSMEKAYGTIIDSIINRVAADSWYGSSIEEVINKNTVTNSGVIIYQYTPLSTSVTGDWTGLGTAREETKIFVNNYVTNRVNGTELSIGIATHYYNPTKSSPSWGGSMANKQ